MRKPVDPDAKVPVSIRVKPSVLKKLEAVAPDWRAQAGVYLEELAAGRGRRAVRIGPCETALPLEELGRKPKPAKASSPKMASEEITPSRAFKSRLKGEWSPR